MDINFQYYPARVESKRPLGTVTLEDLIEAIKSPNEKIKGVFAQIAAAELAGDMELKASLKQNNLYYFTPCVFSNGESRKYVDIDHFTGLAVLDFDHIDNAPALKVWIFDKYKCVVVAFLSASKRGVKFIVKIETAEDVDGFKALFYGLGYEFDKYSGFDGSAQNCVLPLFLSYDPELLSRPFADAETWTKKGLKLKAFKVASAGAKFDVDIKEGDERRVYDNIKKAFDAIHSNGHPQVIAACVSLGGYVASGYTSQADAEAFAFNMIESNAYLQKGITGYKKTALTAIQTGTQSQLTIK